MAKLRVNVRGGHMREWVWGEGILERLLWSNLPQRLVCYYPCFTGGETEDQKG